KVGGAVERHANRSTLASQGREDRLTDPPHGVGDELDALVGIEFSGGSEQADVALTDEVDEGQSPVLVLLGYGDDEAQVALDQFLERVLIARANFLREVDLLRSLEERIRRHLIEVLVEDVAFGLVWSDPSGGRATTSTLEFGHGCGLPSRPQARLES